MKRLVDTCLIALVSVAIVRAEAPAFSDPEPPKVNALPAAAAPKSIAYKRVTFHRAPSPLSPKARTQAWTCFLGPNHNGVSNETHVQKAWPKEGPRPVWELAAGDGYASPAVRFPYLVYPHRIENRVVVECLHAETGASFWQHSFPTQYRDRLGYSNGPRATPLIDGDRVYIYSAEGLLICLQLESGRVFWQRNLQKEFKVPQDFFGAVGTPLLSGDLLVINVGAPKGPTVAAFNKLTGRMVWGAGKQWGPSYASPIPATFHGKQRVLVFAGGESMPPTGGLMMIDPTNGRLDFSFPWRSRKYESVNATCPVIEGNRIFISASYQTGSALLEIKPDLSASEVWRLPDSEHNTKPGELGIHWSTPIVRDGHLYGFDGRNEPDASLVCVNLKTGKVVWREEPEWEQTVTVMGTEQRLTLSTLRGSMLHVEGRFLVLGELGQLLWMDLSPKGLKIVQRSSLFLARESWAPPVLSRGLLYISQNAVDPVTRKRPRLICYDLRGK